MARYTSGMQVAGGYYWSPRSWSVEVVPQEGAKLPGAANVPYVRIPFLALFVIVPLMGAGFLMSLPVIGFAVFANAIFKKVTRSVKAGAKDLAATVAPGGFATGEAHLTGKTGTTEIEKGEAKATAELERLEKEIAERKKTGKKTGEKTEC